MRLPDAIAYVCCRGYLNHDAFSVTQMREIYILWLHFTTDDIRGRDCLEDVIRLMIAGVLFLMQMRHTSMSLVRSYIMLHDGQHVDVRPGDGKT